MRPATLLLLAAMVIATSGCAVADRMSGVSEAKRLREAGTPATARILKIWDTGITVNDDPVIGMEVEVSREDSSVYTATIPKSLISRLDIPQFQPGMPVSVRIDPQDPAKMAIDMYKYR
jgi:hypothetical protein